MHRLFRRQSVIESLESRTLLTTYTVSTTSDDGPGSLRQAILDSNADTTQANTIDFLLTPFAASAGGIFIISPTSPLPTITQAVDIDGTSQGGFANTNVTGYQGTPVIEIEGSGAGTAADGLDITANNSAVKALEIGGFENGAIEVSAASGVSVVSSYLGVGPDGTTFAGNGFGVIIDNGAHDNTIGGTTAADRNVISGNSGGILVTGAASQVLGDTIEGNYIGTDFSGTANLGNEDYGIIIVGSPATIRDNLISGNGEGVGLQDSTGVLIQGNYIGTNAAGTSELSNGTGVDIFSGSSNDTIGGTSSGEGNLISGNDFGILFNDASNITIEGNDIGTNASASAAVANEEDGIEVRNDFHRNYDRRHHGWRTEHHLRQRRFWH